jgi:hypothetical protein
MCATNRFVLEESLGGGSEKTPTKKALFRAIYKIGGITGK